MGMGQSARRPAMPAPFGDASGQSARPCSGRPFGDALGGAIRPADGQAVAVWRHLSRGPARGL
eukprot:9455363-Lingulodinium_polyedra.AAC.1